MGLLFIIAATVLTVSCTKENGGTPRNPNGGSSGNSNSLSGTTWTAPYGSDELFLIKFTSNSQCESYFADRNLNFVRSARQGSYTVSGSTVTFTGIEFVHMYMVYELHSGTISGNFMNTKGENYTSTTSGGESVHYEWDKTWNKR